MALSTVLEIVTQACDEVNLTRPTVVATASTPQERRLFSLLNAAGRDLVRQHEWGDLLTLATITAVAATSDYDLPTDYHRMVSDTHWNRSTKLRMNGPDSPQRDRWRRESINSAAALHLKFRQVGTSTLRVYPTPTTSGETLVYEYVSRNWARSSADAAQAQFQADTDTSIYDADLLVKELKWRWRSSNGLDAEMQKYERDQALALLIAADRGATALNLANRRRRYQGETMGGDQPDVIITDSGDYLLWD